jgi:hypothetical protein
MREVRAESLSLPAPHSAVLRSTWVALTAAVLASPLSMALLSARRAWAQQDEAAVMGVLRPADRVRLVLAQGLARVLPLAARPEPVEQLARVGRSWTEQTMAAALVLPALSERLAVA